MAENTKIEWTDHTFNPWWGCAHVHTGCLNCYAEKFAKRTGKAKWGGQGTRTITSDANWRLPLKWNREAERAGVRRRVFCASMCDVFEEWDGRLHSFSGAVLKKPYGSGACDVTIDDVRAKLFALIDSTPWLDWQLLTKRPELIAECWNRVDTRLAGLPQKYRENVWLGTSVSDEETADSLIPALLECHHLAPVLFASYEPAIGHVDFAHIQFDGIVEIDALHGTHGVYRPHAGHGEKLDWIIVGGESGPGARPFNVQWARDTIHQCRDAGVACFVKQLGSRPVNLGTGLDFPEGVSFRRDPEYGNGAAVILKDRKGGDMAEWPEDLRVREFPKIEAAVPA